MAGTRGATRILLSALVLTTVGCGDDDSANEEFEALFSASSPATPNSIYGVWGALISSNDLRIDTRFKFSPDAVVGAVRCYFPDRTTVLVGVRTSATVTASTLTVYETKEDRFDDGFRRCNANVRPTQSNYTIDGFTMNFGDITIGKLSD